MNFLELAKSRYSCRTFENRQVEDSDLQLVLEAGRIAPSASNNQPWYFITIQQEENLLKVKSCYKKTWLVSAPMLIVICGDHSRSWKREDGKDHCDIDVAIAIDHMTLAATSAGMATCWVCKFDARRCAEILNLPDFLEPVALLPLGYPIEMANPERHKTLRKSLDEVVMKECWKGK